MTAPMEIRRGSVFGPVIQLWEDEAGTIPMQLPGATTARVQFRADDEDGDELFTASTANGRITLTLGDVDTPATLEVALTAADTRLLTGKRAWWTAEITPGGVANDAWEFGGPVRLRPEGAR